METSQLVWLTGEDEIKWRVGHKSKNICLDFLSRDGEHEVGLYLRWKDVEKIVETGRALLEDRERETEDETG